MYLRLLRLIVPVALSACSRLPAEVTGCMDIARLQCECWEINCLPEEELEPKCLENEFVAGDEEFLPCYASVLEENCEGDWRAANDAAIATCSP